MYKKGLFKILGLSLIMAAAFSGCGLEKNIEVEATGKAETGAVDQTTTETIDMTEIATEATTEAVTEKATEATTEATTEKKTEAETDKQNDNIDEKTSDSDMASSASADLKAYSDFISDPYSYEWEKIGNPEQEFAWDSFQLVELDGDDSQEMIITCKNETSPDDGLQHYLILDNTDSGLVINEMADGVAAVGGYRGTLYYLPGSAVIYDMSVSAPYGAPGFTLYKAENGKINYVESGYFNPDHEAGADAMDQGEWYWGSDVVTQEEFDSKVDELSESQSGIAFNEIQYMDKDSMMKELNK